MVTRKCVDEQTHIHKSKYLILVFIVTQHILFLVKKDNAIKYYYEIFMYNCIENLSISFTDKK